jgi:hypothetical protein
MPGNVMSGNVMPGNVTPGLGPGIHAFAYGEGKTWVARVGQPFGYLVLQVNI